MQRFLLTLGLMCLVVGIAYVHLGQPALGVDDAHIFFTYARNIVSGEGVVFNPSGERVEGFSSPLWLLVVAATFALFPKFEWLLLAVSVLMVAGAVAVLWRFVDGRERVTLRGLLLLAWVVSSPSFTVWTSLTLMDTALWSSLLILGTVAALSAESPGRLAMLVSLIVLTRPEGMLWGLALIGGAGLVTATQRGLTFAWHRVRLPLGMYGVVLGGLLALRMAYFGYPLPNTYYAKISSDISYNLREGIIYLLAFIKNNIMVVATLDAIVAGLVLNMPRLLTAVRSPSSEKPIKRGRYVAMSLIALVGLLVPVWTGGDHFGLFRFYQPVWPLLLLPVFGLIDVLPAAAPNRIVFGLTVLAVVAFFTTPLINWGNRLYKPIRHEFSIAEDGQTVGATLNSLFEDNLPSIGVITVGGLALEYDGTVVDLMGLCNPAMAHAPGDRYGPKNHAAFNVDVFLMQQPDLFMPMTGPREALIQYWRDTFDWHNLVLKGLLEDKRFLATYQFVTISKSDKQIVTHAKRVYLDRLAEQGFEVDVINHRGP